MIYSKKDNGDVRLFSFKTFAAFSYSAFKLSDIIDTEKSISLGKYGMR
jgi:hypothetical protein